jgi:dihydrofolate reductase
MAKLILFNFITIDGFFETKNHELFWHNLDNEFHEFSRQQLNDADTFVFGRKTYELMKHYWTSKEAMENDPIVAGVLNSYHKIVFSRSLDEVKWTNSILFNNNIEDVINRLKQKTSKDILLLGSANLSSTLQALNLIDEYRIMVNLILLGQGIPLFKPTDKRQKMELIKTKVFNSGNVLLYYKPK